MTLDSKWNSSKWNSGPKFTNHDRLSKYAEIVEAFRKGEPATEICKRYGISRGMTSRIIRKASRSILQMPGVPE